MQEKLKQTTLRVMTSWKARIAAGILVFYALAGFFVLPWSVERFLPGILGERLYSEVTLERVRCNPFAMTLEVTDFMVREPGGEPIAGFERLFVNIQISSLFRWALTFREIVLDAPLINVVIDGDGTVNLSRLAGPDPEGPAEPAPSREAGRPPRLLVYAIAINDGAVALTDHRQPGAARASLSPVSLHVSDISTLPDREGVYHIKATGGDGSLLEWTGRATLHPLRSAGTLALQGLPLATPWEFARASLNISPPEGRLDLETGYHLDFGGTAPVAALADLRLSLADTVLSLADTEKAFLSLPDIELGVGAVDLFSRSIDDAWLAVAGGFLEAIIDSEGTLNFQRILRVGGTAAGPEPGVDDGAAAKEMASGDAANDDASRGDLWTVRVPAVNLQGLSLGYTDNSRMPSSRHSVEGFDLAFRAAIDTGAGGFQAVVNDLDLKLRRIVLAHIGAARPAVQVDEVALTGGAVDVAGREAFLSGIAVRGGMVDVVRDEAGAINLISLFEAEPATAPKNAGNEEGEDAGAPWRYHVENISLSGFGVEIADVAVNPTGPIVALDGISLALSDFDGTAPSPFEARLRVVQGGDLSVSGRLDPASGSLDSKVTVTGLAIPVAQPYLAQAADLTLESGSFSTKGTFRRDAEGAMAFRGGLDIRALRVIENTTKDVLVGWDQLGAPDVQLDLDPDRLAIGRLRIAGLKAKLIISEDGAINVVEAFRRDDGSPAGDEPAAERQEASAEAPKGDAGKVFPVVIDRVTLDGGVLHFADLSLMPQFDTMIHELKGTIEGISSVPGVRTRISLEGRVDRYGSNRITGEVDSFDPVQYTNIVMAFHNLDMTKFTPYSGKFAGREIIDGRLSLELEYAIEQRRLMSHHQIVIDSLRLGKRVESPDAVRLPLDLAVALLKDSRGVITIGLPVTGTLDDPEFRYGPLVWRALTTLLTRIATSPFRALGGLLGVDDRDLNQVAFSPGQRSIPPSEQEKLDKLVKALLERPELKIAISGRYHREADAPVLREMQIRRAAAEIAEMDPEPGEEPPSLDFTAPETGRVLAVLFAERYGAETLDELRDALRPPVEEENDAEEREDPAAFARGLFAELVAREPLEDNALGRLADARAAMIKAYLTEPEEGLPPERVQVTPRDPAPADSLSAELSLEPVTERQ